MAKWAGEVGVLEDPRRAVPLEGADQQQRRALRIGPQALRRPASSRDGKGATGAVPVARAAGMAERPHRIVERPRRIVERPCRVVERLCRGLVERLCRGLVERLWRLGEQLWRLGERRCRCVERPCR